SAQSHIQIPPMSNIRPISAIYKPPTNVDENAGRVKYSKSTQRIIRIKAAIFARFCGRVLTALDSKTAKGKANCKKTNIKPITPQPPSRRTVYQPTSSARLPEY